MPEKHDDRQGAECAVGQPFDIGLDNDLLGLPEMAEDEDLAPDMAGPEEGGADRLGRIVRRRQDGHFGADHPRQRFGQGATVRRHDRGVVPRESDAGKGECHRRGRRVHDQPLATEVLAQGADDAEEAWVARGQDADPLPSSARLAMVPMRLGRGPRSSICSAGPAMEPRHNR